MRMRNAFVFAGVLICGCLLPVESAAIIVFGGDNDSTTGNPGCGVPFDSVGGMAGGSGVYLGNGYVLTAKHVSIGDITFGSAVYHVDSSVGKIPINVPGSNVDLAVFKLTESPNVAAVTLYGGGVERIGGVLSVVAGWGVGRDPSVSVDSNIVAWGNASTRAHRWGTQTVVAAGFAPAGDGYPYSYFALQTHAAGTSQSSAALTVYDSGGALFTNVDGNWYLSGIAAGVQKSGSSTFGDDLVPGDMNQFVNVAPYKNQILTLVPEPSAWAFAGGVFAGALALMRVYRRQRRK